MITKTKLLCTALLSMAVYTAGFAQEVKPASGGNASGSGGSASYSVGQVFYTAPNGAGGSSGLGIQSIAIVSEVLPVKFVSFKVAKYDNSSVLITWQTATEQDNDYFAIEKSTDGVVFTEFTRIKGKGTSSNISSYKTMDFQPQTGNNYYRIRQTDKDGSSTYTPVSTIQFSASGTSISVFPNPTSSAITLQADYSVNSRYQLSDLTGNVIENKPINSGRLQINVGQLPAAIYTLNILRNNKIVETFKITKL